MINKITIIQILIIFKIILQIIMIKIKNIYKEINQIMSFHEKKYIKK